MKRLLLQLCVAVFFMSSLCPFCFADFAKTPPPESTSAPAAASTPEQARTLAAAPAKEPPPAQAPAASVAPKFFTIISPLGTSTTALDETIRLQIDGNRPVECKDLTLLLGDYPGLASGCTPLPGRQFLFTLGRGDKNHEAWRGILGKPLAGQRDRELPVYLAVSQRQLEHMNETPGSVFVRRYITGLWLTVIGLIVGIGVSTLLWFGRRTSMFRDAGIPQQSLSERTYSLGRCQMGWWFFWTISAFAFVWAITGTTDALKPESLVLIGISGATALGAVAIDQSKTDISNIGLQASQMGLNTPEDVTKLRTLADTSPAGVAAETFPRADGTKPATTNHGLPNTRSS